MPEVTISQLRGFVEVTSRTRRGPSDEPVPPPDDDVLEVLTEEDMVLVAQHDFVREEAAARRTRGVGEPDMIALDVEVGANESAAVLVEQDGVYSWAFPDDVYRARRTRGAGAGPAGVHRITFQLVAEPEVRGSTRGPRKWLGRIFGRRIRTFVLKFTAPVVAGAVMRMLENKVDEGLVRIDGPDPEDWRRIDTLAGSQWPAKPRILLLVHGTFSSTDGTYKGLAHTPAGRQFLEDATETYDAVLGFDHRTLSADPLDNAYALLKALSKIDSTEPPEVDAVAFSRGGLVLRSLIEIVQPTSDWKARFPKVAMVGATNGGTELANPENWHDLINLYTNIALAASRVFGLATGTAPLQETLSSILRGLAGFAKYLATYAVEDKGVPGLAAMDPHGDFVRALNSEQPGQPSPEEIDYYAVISDFEAGRLGEAWDENSTRLSSQILLTLSNRVVDRLMQTENDLVVHTASMTAIDEAVKGYVKDICDYGSNPIVYHLVYFAQETSVAALYRWLMLEKMPVRLRQTLRARRVAEPFALPVTFRPPRAGPESEARRRRPALAAMSEEPVTVKLEVVWGDITTTKSDVYAVGHYHGVLPQQAELALDRAISGVAPDAQPSDPDVERHLILTQLTRKNMIRGELGEINFYPWHDPPGDGMGIVAVCGMGLPGRYSEMGQRTLYRNLTWILGGFADVRELATVMIGSGEGTLPIRTAVRGMLAGIVEGARGVAITCQPRTIRIVERGRGRAEEILASLGNLVESSSDVSFELNPKLVVARGGVLEADYRLSQAIRGLAEASAGGVTNKTLERALELNEGEISGLRVTLAELSRDRPPRPPLQVRVVDEKDARREYRIPTRITISAEGSVLRIGAITDTTTVTERIVEIDPTILHEVVDRMTDPQGDDVARLARLLRRLVIPPDFRDILEDDNPIVFEVNRLAAHLQWEMLAASEGERNNDPIGLIRSVTRQVRTTYSQRPLPKPPRETLRALVIGDPSAKYSLPGARREALMVAEMLRRKGFDVVEMIGAPSYREKGIRPVSRLDIIELFLAGSIDLVHYAGHGTFDPDDPGTAGWLCDDGMLSARELQQVGQAPSLIFANACLTAQITRSGEPVDRTLRKGDQSRMLPTLADEFFRRGVRNYIGTAWEVEDEGAVLFARTFYDAFLPATGRRGASLGDALFEARQKVAVFRHHGALWAAYQHYGDPRFAEEDL